MSWKFASSIYQKRLKNKNYHLAQGSNGLQEIKKWGEGRDTTLKSLAVRANVYTMDLTLRIDFKQGGNRKINADYALKFAAVYGAVPQKIYKQDKALVSQSVPMRLNTHRQSRWERCCLRGMVLIWCCKPFNPNCYKIYLALWEVSCKKHLTYEVI